MEEIISLKSKYFGTKKYENYQKDLNQKITYLVELS